MQKFLILTSLACVVTNGAYAACPSSGTCYIGNASSATRIDDYCTDATSGCTYRTCDGVCTCSKSCKQLGGGGELQPTDPTCPDDCPNTDWTQKARGYEVRCAGDIFLYCEYRCANGYYGSPTSTSSGCTLCPIIKGGTSSSIAGENSSITDCFIAAGESFSDTTGSGTYTANCYYTE